MNSCEEFFASLSSTPQQAKSLKIQTGIKVILYNVIFQLLGFPSLEFIRSIKPQDYGIQIKFDSKNLFLSYHYHSTKPQIIFSQVMKIQHMAHSQQTHRIDLTGITIDALKQSVSFWGNSLQMKTVRHKQVINIKIFS